MTPQLVYNAWVEQELELGKILKSMITIVTYE